MRLHQIRVIDGELIHRRPGFLDVVQPKGDLRHDRRVVGVIVTVLGLICGQPLFGQPQRAHLVGLRRLFAFADSARNCASAHMFPGQGSIS